MGTRPGSLVPSVPFVPFVPSCACLLLLVLVPNVSHAAVVVAEPTGDADTDFLAELKASLEIVAAEAPAEMNANLRSSASNHEAGWELVVELVPNDGKDPIRETRIVSKASARSQARAMGRAAIKTLAATPPAQIVEKPKTEEAPVAKAVVGSEIAPTPLPTTEVEARAPAPAPQRYNRTTALLISALPTAVLVVGGSVLFGVGFTHGGGFPLLVSGTVLAGTGLVFGPMPGWFYVGRWRHALLMSTLRLGVVGTGVFSFIMWLNQGESNSDVCDTGDGRESSQGCSHNPFGLMYAMSALATAVVMDIIEVALLGRAADRANEQYRKSLQVTVAPVAWSSGNGDRTFGLALNGSF